MTIKNKDGSDYKLSENPPPIDIKKITRELTPITSIVPEVINVPIKTIDISTPEPEVVNKQEEKETTKVYCLPATRIADPIYGDSTLSYGKQVNLECLFIESGDLSCILWCNTKINEGSILYVPEDRRWWKVNSKSEKEGWILQCVPSELQPSFSL